MSGIKFPKMKQLFIWRSQIQVLIAEFVFTKNSNFFPFWVDLAGMYRPSP